MALSACDIVSLTPDGDVYAEGYMLEGYQEWPMAARHQRTYSQFVSHPLCARLPVQEFSDEAAQADWSLYS